MGWQKEWPQPKHYKVELYWFYGYDFQSDYDGRFDKKEPELMIIKVARCSNSWMYSVGSHFIHKSEGAVGLFKKVDLPEMPTLEEWQIAFREGKK